MEFDLPGRIRHTRLLHSDALLPLFEAVINSIHAINELHSSGNGTVRIRIEREQSQQGLSFDQASRSGFAAIESFVVSDDGIGFTDAHFKSFSTADTQQKAAQGGKGVGRFLWLKAFDHAEVDSIFKEATETYQRKFSLRLTDSGVEGHTKTEAAGQQLITSVRLCNINPEYQQHLPRSAETIARKIVEHCLEYFVLGSAPAIYVHDSDSEEVHALDEFFEQHVRVTSTVEHFEAGKRQFHIHHLKVGTGYQDTHRLHFCANNRAVASENLAGKIANMAGSIRDEANRPFLYAGYVSGQYLDDTANSERTDFVMPHEDSVLGDPSWGTVLEKSINCASSFVSPYTTQAKDAKEQRITEYVRSRAPQYRPVVKHRRDLLDRVPLELSDDKLDKITQLYEADLRQESGAILTSLQKGPEDWDRFREQYAKFLEEWNESGIAKLARHIVHRKATLDFLKASLKVGESGKYRLESAIHQLIFPLKKTSDDVRPDQMNLWILDEKLTYHYYLASDIPFDKQEISLPSKERADIIIFNGPSAFASDSPPFSSIVIVEFKRPLRDDFTDEDNPIAQIYRYVELLKSGKAKDRGGRPITIKADTPIYAYLICDLTPTLATQARYASLAPTPDGLGYFGFNLQLGVLVEIMGFDKLVSDAERRNAAHFDQLNLPPS